MDRNEAIKHIRAGLKRRSGEMMQEFESRRLIGMKILQKRIRIQDGCGCKEVFERKLLATVLDILEMTYEVDANPILKNTINLVHETILDGIGIAKP